MRCFAIVAAVCLLAAQAHAWNITESISCVSDHMSKAMRDAFDEATDRVNNIDGERQDITETFKKQLDEVRSEFDADLKQRLSEIDTNCEEGNPLQRARCFVQSRVQMMFAATGAGTNALRKAAKILADHASDFGSSRVDGMKSLAQLIGSSLPKLLSAARSCF